MENLSVLTGKYGAEGDQLIFKVLNSGDFLKGIEGDDLAEGSKRVLPKISEKGLRYDLTVPFARYVVQNQHDITFPFKRYQVQPVWRADRPQKGRYREFYQCDADIIGSNSEWPEVELSLLVHDVFQALALEDYVLKINHREILFGLANWLGLKGQEIPFCATVDKLDKIGTEKVVEEIRALGPDAAKLNAFQELLATNGPESLEKIESIIADNIGTAFVKNYFQTLAQFENRLLKVEFDWTLARGLSYYTGLIFEAKPTSVQMGSILGGGRYDNLTGMFGLPNVSGVGISFGIDRIFDVLEELQLFPREFGSSRKVLITHLDKASFLHAAAVLDNLRAQGINADLYPDIVKMKKQISYANKIGVPFSLTVGPEEIESGCYSLKNMTTGQVDKLSLEDIMRRLTN